MRALYFIRFLTVDLGGSLLAFSGATTSVTAQVFTVDTNLSSITISGVIGATSTSEAKGSLTTIIGGTIELAVVGNTIQFTGHSQIFAETNGSWQPSTDGTSGSAPADFGGQANLGIASGVAALRSVQLDAISPAISINAGQFDSASLTFLFPSNSVSSLAYNVSGLINKHGSVALTGYATNKVTKLGSLATSGNQQTLTIPVDATFLLNVLSANDTLRLQGQLVAVQNTQAPLQVQSVVVQNQAVMLQWQSAPGQQFQVQSSTDLAAWQTSATIVTPSSGANTWTGAVSGPVGFFRLAK